LRTFGVWGLELKHELGGAGDFGILKANTLSVGLFAEAASSNKGTVEAVVVVVEVGANSSMLFEL